MVSRVGLVDVAGPGEGDLEHGHDSAQLQLVKSLVERLVLVDDGDVADLVNLVKSLESSLDQLSQVDS